MPATSSSDKTSQQAFNRKMSGFAIREPRHVGSPSDVREGLPYAALESLSQELGLTQEVITRVLDVSERTLQRRRKSGRISPSESDRLWRIMHVHRLALEAFDDRQDEARKWLTMPKRALGGDTPIEHLDTEPGERRVEQMLATIEYTMPV